MKKVIFLIFASCLICFLLFSFLFLQKKYENLIVDNNNLIIEIDNIKNDIQITSSNNETDSLEIEKLKIENEGKIKEQNIWLNMKEKLEKALS